MKTRVVKLGDVREFLAEWDRVRTHLLSGRCGGFQSIFMDMEDGSEVIYQCGIYKRDTASATRAQLRMSVARTLEEDEPPLFQASQM